MADQNAPVSGDNAEAAVEAAAKAFRELLGESPRRETTWPVWTAVVVVEALALCALILHTIFGPGRPVVDSTTLGLLILMLLTPIVPRLKTFEFAGVKAEAHTPRTRNIDEVVEVIKSQQEAISKIYNGYVSESVPVSPGEVVATHAIAPGAAARNFEHVLWVDDHPENNSFEMDALAPVLRIHTVATNSEALELLASGEFDAVISDVFRDDDPRTDPSGPRLLAELRTQPRFADLPFFFYTGKRSAASIADKAAELDATVSTQFHSLVRALRTAGIQADPRTTRT